MASPNRQVVLGAGPSALAPRAVRLPWTERRHCRLHLRRSPRLSADNAEKVSCIVRHDSALSLRLYNACHATLPSLVPELVLRSNMYRVYVHSVHSMAFFCGLSLSPDKGSWQRNQEAGFDARERRERSAGEVASFALLRQ